VEKRLGFVSGLTLVACNEMESPDKSYADLAVREWKVLFEEYEVPADQIQKIAPVFRHIDDVATPALSKLIP
jgi:hypothetical protein